MTATMQTFRVQRHSGLEDTTGIELPGTGLAVTKNDRDFAVLHVRSGLVVARFPDAELALAAAVDLHTRHPVFTEDAETVYRAVDIEPWRERWNPLPNYGLADPKFRVDL